jgi:DNA-binding MarR family transcriptional regulator
MQLPLADLPTWILSSAATRSHQILHRNLAAAGVTGYEYRCLAALNVNDHLSQTELGAATVLDRRDVTHTVRALEARGLLSRTKDPRHGRRVTVSLTSAGRKTAHRLFLVMNDVQDEVFGRLSQEEQSILATLLSRVGSPSG